MDENSIASMLLNWERAQKQADYLKEEITKAVLQKGADIVAGSVIAKFNKGKEFKDYQLAVEETPRAMTLLYSDFLKVENLDSKIYKQICEKLEIMAPVKKTTEPTVTLKYEEKK